VRAAAAALTRARTLDPLDQVARYRYARVLAARGDEVHAIAELEQLIAARVAPAFVLASIYLEHGKLVERAGNPTRAIESYRLASQTLGGDLRARDDARDALKRLRAS
jgi:Flp pilus assembly protein TadD